MSGFTAGQVDELIGQIREALTGANEAHVEFSNEIAPSPSSGPMQKYELTGRRIITITVDKPVRRSVAPVCTCQSTPTGLIPTTITCPIHGSWTHTGSTTGAS